MAVFKVISKFLRSLETYQISLRAKSLTYETVLSFVPAVGFIIWYLRGLGITDQVIRSLQRFVLEHLNTSGETRALEILSMLTEATGGKGWGIVGLLVLVYAYWGMIDQFGSALDVIMNRDRKNQRFFSLESLAVLVKRAVLLLSLPVLLILSLFIADFIRKNSWIGFLTQETGGGSFLLLPLGWLVTALVLSFVYYLTPRKKPKFSRALFSAIFAVPALEGAKYLFGWATESAIVTQKIYGVFVAIPLGLLWIFCMWWILLLSFVVGTKQKRNLTPNLLK